MANFPPIQFKRTNVAGRKPTDSDIRVGELAINLADRILYTKDDSDRVIEIGGTSDIDSDILDLKVKIAILRGEKDSDIAVTLVEHDSDVAMTYHNFRAADSDLQQSALQGLDSEILARKSADSDILVLLERIRLQADSDNIVKVSDYDSDVAVLRHDYKAADSDIGASTDSDIQWLRNRILEIEIEHDSDNIITIAEHDSDVAMLYHDYRAADSEIVAFLSSGLAADLDSEINARIEADSDLRASLYVSTLRDVDVVTTPPLHEQVLAWDSDSELWKPKDAASAIANLKDVDLGTGPRHGNILAYDSDAQKWVPAVNTVYYSNEIETFTATAGQTAFKLAKKPFGSILMTRNSRTLVASAVTLTSVDDSDFYATYVQANNGNRVIVANDSITFQYIAAAPGYDPLSLEQSAAILQQYLSLDGGPA